MIVWPLASLRTDREDGVSTTRISRVPEAPPPVTVTTAVPALSSAVKTPSSVTEPPWAEKCSVPGTSTALA